MKLKAAPDAGWGGAHVEVRIGVWSLAAGCQGYPQLRQDK